MKATYEGVFPTMQRHEHPCAGGRARYPGRFAGAILSDKGLELALGPSGTLDFEVQVESR